MVPLAVGLWISGLVSWFVIHRQTDMSDETRLTCYQTVALILVFYALILVIAASVVGEASGMIAAAATFAFALLAVLETGLPVRHPVWQRLVDRRRP